MRFWQSTSFSPPDHLLAIAQASEEAGMEGVILSDHIFFPKQLQSPYPYSADGQPIWTPETPWPDNWVSVGAMAAVTRTLRFGTAIYIAPARDIFTVAKAVGTAALLSNNRVALGAGAGWMKEEFDGLGQDFHTRGKRFDEMFAALRALWTPGWAEYHGRYYDFGPLMMSPAPTQPVPIWCGGDTEPALRRTARYADGWIGNPYTVEDATRHVTRLRELLAEEGRSEVPFEIIIASLDPPSLDTYRRLEDIGIDGVVVVPWLTSWDDHGAGWEGLRWTGELSALQSEIPIETKVEVLQRFSEDFVAKLS